MEISSYGWVLGLLAAFLVGFSKTGLPGLGILIVPMMAGVFPGKLSVGALLPMLLLGDLFAMLRYRRDAQWKQLLRVLPFIFLGMIPARFLLAHIQNTHFKLMLGVLVLLLLLLEYFRRRFKWDHMPHSWLFVASLGILTGFATTVGNVAGPIMSVYLLSMGMLKKEFMGTNAWCFFIVNATKIPIFAQLGMINSDTLQFNLMCLPLIVIGAFVGYKFLPKLPQNLFTRLVYILAAAAALSLISSSL